MLRSYYLFLSLAGFFLVFFSVYFLLGTSSLLGSIFLELQKISNSKFTNIAGSGSESNSGPEKVRSCILNKFLEGTPDFVWSNFSQLITKCVLYHSTISENDFLKFTTAQFDGERKFFLPISPSVPTSEACRFLTIGIGGDTNAEKAFHEHYPHCKMYGIEASEESQGDFGNFGKVIPHAVGVDKAGTLQMRLRDKNDAYMNKEVPVTPLHTLLDQAVGHRLMHFLSIDIEGFEYAVVEGLNRGKIFRREGVHICQIDAEFHIPKMWAGNDFSFYDYFISLLRKSDLLPIHVDKKFGDHKKVVLIDTGSKECNRFFDFDQYFT